MFTILQLKEGKKGLTHGYWHLDTLDAFQRSCASSWFEIEKVKFSFNPKRKKNQQVVIEFLWKPSREPSLYCQQLLKNLPKKKPKQK